MLQQQLENTVPVRNSSGMLQTQECSCKFSSALLSSRPPLPSCVATPRSTKYIADSSGDHVQLACSQTTEHRKTRHFTSSPFPSCESSSCCVNGPLIVPMVQRERDRRHRRLTVQTSSFTVPSSARSVAVQPQKDSSRPSTTSSRLGSARQSRENDNQKTKGQPAGIANIVRNNAAIKQQSYARPNSGKSSNTNSGSSSHQSDFTTLQLVDRSSYRPVSQQKVESGSVARSRDSDSSVRRIPVAILLQNGSVKSSHYTVSRAKRPVNSQLSAGFLPAASDNTADGSTSESVAPKLQMLESEISAVMLTDRAQNDTFNVESYGGHSSSYEEPVSIKIEKRLVSNTPMTVCTLPVSRPAFVCRPVVPETAPSTKPVSSSCSKTVTRSYHETTRPQRRESSPPAEAGEWRRSAMIGKLPYVGADVWELTTRRLQSAVVDKASLGARDGRAIGAAESIRTGSEVNTSSAPRTPPRCLPEEDRSSDISRLVSKCLSAKTVRPKTELDVRGSQSTSRLLQNCAEEDEEEAVDCEIELYVFSASVLLLTTCHTTHIHC